MTIAQDIQPHLSYLRRFARILSGQQESGDAYVVAVLEALVEDPTIFPQDMDRRAALYHVFLKVWNSVAINKMGETFAMEEQRSAADRQITAMTPVARQAFLLVAVERFTPDEAALVLDRTRTQVLADLDAAGREIAEQVATNVLIIEDEPLIALDLESVVTSLGHTVLSIARTRKEAVAAYAAHKPGLILADVQLADRSSGLDAINDILGDSEVPVIFITAYPEQVLTGRRPEPAFLIPKPFQHDMVKAVISQALFFDIKARRRKVFL